MFHSIVYGFSCVKLPDYITPFQVLSNHAIANTVCNKNNGTMSKSIVPKSFFYRVHLSWNKLPRSLKEIIRPSEFKSKLLEYLWNNRNKDEYDECIDSIIFKDPKTNLSLLLAYHTKTPHIILIAINLNFYF